MADTDTYAERQVAGGTLYMRKAPKGKLWRVGSYHRDLNVNTALLEGVLRSEQLADPRFLDRKFSSPDAAATALARFLSA